MTIFILRRLVLMFAILGVTSFLVFAAVEFSPGNVANKMLGPYSTPEQREILYQKLNLDDPLIVRYGRWIGGVLGLVHDPLGDPELGLGFSDPRGTKYFGNLGYSTLFKEPVNDILWDRLGNTGVLAGITFAVLLPLSLAFGVLSGMRAGSITDRSLSLVGATLISIPEFASSVFLMAIFVVSLKWLPGTSPLTPSPDWPVFLQFVLPVTVLVLYDFGYIARMIRGSMVEVMNKDFIRTAILKGLPIRKVVLGHALRNALIAPFTIILLQINWLITGVVVTEVVFSFPGFGRLLLEGALYGDIALIEATTLVALLLAVITRLVGDIGYMYLNPRIRLT